MQPKKSTEGPTSTLEMPEFGAPAPTGTTAMLYEGYRQLVARAVDVFGSELKASKWLSSAQSDLDGQVPLEVAERNNYRSGLFEEIFGRIEHGVYY